MANYAIMRIEKRKIGSVTHICNHHERLKDRYKSNPDINPERTHLNYHINQPKDKYRPMILKRIEESKRLLFEILHVLVINLDKSPFQTPETDGS